MTFAKSLRVVPVVLAVAAAAVFAAWAARGPVDVEPRLPKPEVPIAKVDTGPAPNLGGITLRGEAAVPQGFDGSWPMFRGPGADAISPDPTPLIESWGADGPPKLWTIELGDGHGGAAIHKGAVYLLDYQDRKSQLIETEEIREGKAPAIAARILAAVERDVPSSGMRIWERMDQDARNTVRSLAGAPDQPGSPADRKTLTDALNAVIQSEDFYNEESFTDLKLDREGKKLVKAHQTGMLASFKRDRLHRLLIDATFGRDLLLPAWEGDVIRKLSLETGEEIWRYIYPVNVKQNHGMSRTVPAVTDEYVVTAGPKCHVTCVKADTGELVWGMDLVSRYGTTVPDWWSGQSPIIDGGQVILAPSGPEVLAIGVDLATGKVLWEAPNVDGGVMAHASPSIMDFAGKRFYLVVTARNSQGTKPGGVYGVSREGKILFGTTEWSVSTAAPSALGFPDGKVLLTAGYDEGGMLLQLSDKGDGTFDMQIIQSFETPRFSSEQQTPIYHQGHVFTIIPKTRAQTSLQLMCLTPEGEIVWTSGRSDRYGFGSYVFADGKLFIMGDKGDLSMVIATPQTYRKLAGAKVLKRAHDSWGPIATADGLMIVRDVDRMTCLDLRKK
ncbi:MAG: PQQ-binding-like beta-propeller repeat protein [Phycisphaerae bacterium]